jgi:CheY-like chemotaxis protein
MDLQMPEMNGIDAARRIMRYHPRLVILALTANATPEERIECRDAGMLDIVSKPVTMETLKSMFQTFGSAIRRSMAEKAAAASVQEHGRDGAGDEGREQIQESGQGDEAPEDD